MVTIHNLLVLGIRFSLYKVEYWGFALVDMLPTGKISVLIPVDTIYFSIPSCHIFSKFNWQHCFPFPNAKESFLLMPAQEGPAYSKF